MFRRKLLISFAVLTAVAAAAVSTAALYRKINPPAISRERHKLLKEGMCREEFEAIIGLPPGDWITVPGRMKSGVVYRYCGTVWRGDEGAIEAYFDERTGRCTSLLYWRDADEYFERLGLVKRIGISLGLLMPTCAAESPDSRSNRPERSRMNLSHASTHAVTALVYLIWEKPSAPVAARRIAKAEGIPESLLERTLHPLAAAGILRSVKGPNGGYRLARPPKDITLLEIVEAVEGPLVADAGAVNKEGTASDKRLQAVCDEALAVVREQLEKVMLAELAKGK